MGEENWGRGEKRTGGGGTEGGEENWGRGYGGGRRELGEGVRRGEKRTGGGGTEGGRRGRLYTCRYTVTTMLTCIKMGSDERHFNVLLIVRDEVTRQSIDHNV